MRAARRSLAAACAALALLAAPAARARDPERAAQLFRAGRDAMAAHDYELACRKFVESESADPRVGTLINLALCEQATGRLATARQYWQQASDLARALGDARVDYCAEQLAHIDGRVPRLTIRLDGAAPPDAEVRRDRVDFGAGSLGVALPVEIGQHSIEVRAPKHTPSEVTIYLREGERREIVVAPGPLVVEPAPRREIAAPAPSAAPPLARDDRRAPLRTAAYVTGALGVVGLGAGAYFGARALDARGGTTGHCDGDVCDPIGAAARRDEQRYGNVATIGLLSGAALLAGAATLRVLAPSPEEAPHVRRNLALVAGGAGLAAVGVGALFGLRAIAANADAASGCNGDVCNHAGAAARRETIAAGDVSTAAFVVGGALLATGVVLWTTAPRPSTPTTGSLVAGATSLRVEGTF